MPCAIVMSQSGSKYETKGVYFQLGDRESVEVWNKGRGVEMSLSCLE